jgi:DNA-binding PadR family transcriptional regulator
MLDAHTQATMGDTPDRDDVLPLRPVEFDVLLALAGGERHGYGILQEVQERSDGAVALEPGTLYRALRRMLGAGLVARSAARRGDDDDRRRYYRLTELGRRVAAAEASRLAGLVLAARSRGLLRKA